jgi:hypothetical protein
MIQNRLCHRKIREQNQFLLLLLAVLTFASCSWKLGNSQPDSFALRDDEGRTFIRINGLGCALDQTGLASQSPCFQLKNGWRWDGFTNLFVADIIVLCGGTSSLMTESHLFVFRIQCGQLQPVLRLPWTSETKSKDGNWTEANDFHFGKSENGNALIWEGATLESWEIRETEVANIPARKKVRLPLPINQSDCYVLGRSH